jgi:hypothetical protein
VAEFTPGTEPRSGSRHPTATFPEDFGDATRSEAAGCDGPLADLLRHGKDSPVEAGDMCPEKIKLRLHADDRSSDIDWYELGG